MRPGVKCCLSRTTMVMQQNNIALRIPVPFFGEGLIESISDDTIMGVIQSAFAQDKQNLGISGQANRSGNDGSITRFGWKVTRINPG